MPWARQQIQLKFTKDREKASGEGGRRAGTVVDAGKDWGVQDKNRVGVLVKRRWDVEGHFCDGDLLLC